MDKWKVCDQTMNQSEKILEIKDLCVEFKTVEGTVKAINHLNYTLHKGEKLGIVGESGSGKSVTSLGIMQFMAIKGNKKKGRAQSRRYQRQATRINCDFTRLML
ncbi:MAG: ATP-binding cassette domain-containing protein [Coprococcus catus]|nr:ATP-binding cassette domain-containing protein [Coprococcus catus]